MRLTAQYRHLYAVFDLPVEYKEEVSKSGTHYRYHFEVSPFKFMAYFSENRSTPNEFFMGFVFSGVTASISEITDQVSRRLGRPVPEYIIKDRVQRMKYEPFQISGLSGPTGAAQVMSHMVSITRDFIKNRNPSRLIFSADEKSRNRLYQSMVRRFAPGVPVSREVRGKDDIFTLHLDKVKK
jgi:hypothetical protein